MDDRRLLKEYLDLYLEKVRSMPQDPSGDVKGKFDMRKFTSIESLDQLNKYAEQYLQVMGTGSSRRVYVLTSRYALKVAINAKGIDQNEAEQKVSSDPSASNYIARIHKADPDKKWVVSDLVKPIRNINEFEKLTKTKWFDFVFDVEDMTRGKNKPKASTLARAAAAIVNNHVLGVGELRQLDHWGKTPDGRVVILDYGLDSNTYIKHYQADHLKQLKSDGQASDKEKSGGKMHDLPATA